MRCLKYVFLFSLGAVFISSANAQEFAPGIELYNHAQYDSLVHGFCSDFIKNHPDEEGLATYFLAESFYNKALSSGSLPDIKANLISAKQEFGQAISSADLRVTFPAYADFAQYKIGWCWYRLAELKKDPENELSNAYKAFRSVHAEAADSIKIFANLMALDCKVKSALLLFSKLQYSGNSHARFQQILASLNAAEKIADTILQASESPSAPDHLQELKTMTRLQKRSLDFYRGKCFQIMTDSEFAQLENSSQSGKNRKAMALEYFQKLDRGNVLPESALKNSGLVNAYFRLMAALNEYYLDRTPPVKQRTLREYGRLLNSAYQDEILFRRANLEASHPNIDSDSFNELASVYYDSVQAVPEADYWLGSLALILNQTPRSLQRFQAFLSEAPSATANLRLSNLIENARYKIFLLKFESFYLSGRRNNIQKLARDLASFQPKNQEVKKNREQLNLLVNCSLSNNTQQIWTDVLQGTDNQKLEQALNTIGFILPRAAVQIGANRDKYIQLINRLLAITQLRRSDATRFFRGIAQSLQAEIEATPIEKTEKFKRAAKTLQRISDGFANKAESEYIRARCLFFADDYDAAKGIFRKLIREGHSLRALFYLAEIYRSEKNDLAAGRCYETIMGKLSGSPNADFWLQNATAGLAAIGHLGDASVLDSLYIEQVQIRQNASGEIPTYEQLAEERYLKQIQASENVDWLMHYGLPLKENLMSRNQITGSFFLKENHFAMPGPLDEVRHPVTSTLALTVLLPENVTDDLTVTLDGTPVSEKEGVFVQTGIPLNARKELRILNPVCDEFHGEVVFSTPAVDEQVIVLNRKFAFRESGKTANLYTDYNYSFKPRADLNYIMHRLPELDPESELLRDFSHSFDIRDCVFDSLRQRILVVNARENAVLVYSGDRLSHRIGELVLPEGMVLNQPEGIALDSEGNIYVTDWGNHRLLALTQNGHLLHDFGALGSNSNAELGKPIKLAYPSRVSIIEDTEGETMRNGKVSYKATYILVSDFNGIQQISLDGRYMGTVVLPNQTVASGEFYGLTSEKYDDKARLSLILRLAPNPGDILPYVPQIKHNN